MRFPFSHLFFSSPFDGLQEHADKVKECSWAFQQAIECYISKSCKAFEDLKQKVIQFENEADSIKRKIIGHLPKASLLPADKYEFFRYLGEQDSILNAAQNALDWISFRQESRIPDQLEKDFLHLVDLVIERIEGLSNMLTEASKYFKKFSEKQRKVVREIISKSRQQGDDTDNIETILKQKIFHLDTDPITIFHLIRLVEFIGAIADNADKASDLMVAMVAR